jgi:S1-C subfamily serine protease
VEINVKYLISIILMISPLSLAAKTPPADVILEEANQYTVKIRRGSTVGLNEDDGTSAQATGFLVDRARGWILTNAHVASRSPATLIVSFKGEKYISARRVFVDRLLDVAVLEVEPPPVRMS